MAGDRHYGGPTDEPGFGFGAENGAFSALFGERGDRLMRFELGQRSLGLGLPDTATPVRPEVSGERMLFRDVVGSSDLRYMVGADAVKEEIVLEHAPESEVFTFDMQLSGVEAVLTQASTARHVQLKQRAGNT